MPLLCSSVLLPDHGLLIGSIYNHPRAQAKEIKLATASDIKRSGVTPAKAAKLDGCAKPDFRIDPIQEQYSQGSRRKATRRIVRL